MRIKLFTTLALLLMAVSGAWAENYLYLEVTSTSTATLKYGDPGSDSGKPYYNRNWYDNGYNGDWDYFKRNNCTAITVDMNDQSFEDFKPSTLENLFKEFTALEAIDGLGNLNTSDVKNMEHMFEGCSSLTTLYLSGWNTSEVTNMSNMFNGCTALTTLDLTGWDTSKVTDMGHMFYDCSSLTTLDLSGWNTSEVTNMSNMFNGCSSLTTLDLTGWDTSKVTNMGQMFHTCSELTMLDLSGWNTSKVEDMFEMFLCCEKLLTLNLSGWDTSNVTNMGSIFAGCKKLAILTLDPVKWSTANVTKMEWMFEGCSSLTTLDLSEWNTSKVENMHYMFYYCEKLETIYVGDGWSTTKVTDSGDMFNNCTSLPNWESTNPTDKTHANTGASGYLNKVKLAAHEGATGEYWATYYNGTHGFTADANTTVYQAKVNGTKTAVVLTEVTSKEIPADKGVVLKSSDESIILSVATTTATYSDNDLLGTDVDLATPANAYCLSKETTGSARGVGFYLYTPSDGAVIPAHRAYLQIPSSARSFYGFGNDSHTTDIDLPEAVVIEGDGPIYDLSGRLVTGQPQKGIYVKNGKKVVIK